MSNSPEKEWTDKFGDPNSPEVKAEIERIQNSITLNDQLRQLEDKKVFDFILEATREFVNEQNSKESILNQIFNPQPVTDNLDIGDKPIKIVDK